jgi:GNAT superfamily N-acetyltransferase
MYKQQIFKSDSEFPESLKWQVLSFLRINSPEGFKGSNESRDWINNPDDNSIHIAFITENDVLISYCSVVRKQLEHVGELYNCWGLTGVMTYPPFRDRGFGKQVVDIATRIIKESDADIGMFHCVHKLKGFYTKSGWEPMKKTTTLVGNKKNPNTSSELMMMLFLSRKAQLHRGDFEIKPVYFGEDTW